MIARTFHVGGRQGRGDPQRPAPAPAPDVLAYALADHIRTATPGVRINPFHSAWTAVVTWKLTRLVLLSMWRQQYLARGL